MTIYELYGRLMEERQIEHEAHLKTIDLLARIKAGKVSIDQVVLTPDSWRVLDPDDLAAKEANRLEALNNGRS